jgi:thiol-disulfide isomerase/thioredoxin
VSQDEICKEGDKPIVYFFGSSTCPHCIWEKPVVEDVVSKFKDNIVSHINIDSNNDADIFQKYDPEGYVPTLVLGCKYYRVGSGEQAGTEQESKDLTALICKITGNQPSEVCSPVQDLIDQAK